MLTMQINRELEHCLPLLLIQIWAQPSGLRHCICSQAARHRLSTLAAHCPLHQAMHPDAKGSTMAGGGRRTAVRASIILHGQVGGDKAGQHLPRGAHKAAHLARLQLQRICCRLPCTRSASSACAACLLLKTHGWDPRPHSLCLLIHSMLSATHALCLLRSP